MPCVNWIVKSVRYAIELSYLNTQTVVYVLLNKDQLGMRYS